MGVRDGKGYLIIISALYSIFALKLYESYLEPAFSMGAIDILGHVIFFAFFLVVGLFIVVAFVDLIVAKFLEKFIL
jgi:hypothetical protein